MRYTIAKVALMMMGLVCSAGSAFGQASRPAPPPPMIRPSTQPASRPAVPATAPAIALDDPARVGKWRADIAQLATELPQKHKNAFFSIKRGEWERATADLSESVPRLTDVEIVLGISRLAAMIGDGHTMAMPDPRQWPMRQLPVGVRRFSDGVFITRATPAHKDLLGAQLIGIGDDSTDDAVRKIGAFISHDNQATLQGRAMGWLTIAEALHAAGIVPDADHVPVTVRDGQGRESVVELVPPPAGTLGRGSWIALPLNIESWPLGLQQRKGSYWYEWVDVSKAVYIRYDRCADDPGETVGQFAGKALACIDSNAAERVVIDLRNNGGGNSALLAPLVEGLKSRQRLVAKERVFVLIGPGTFSSGTLNAWQLKQDVHATLVGEPTGGKPNSFGEVRKFTLANSGIDIQYSTKLFFIDKNDPPSLMPHVTVEMSLADFLTARDPALEAALKGKILP